MERLQHLIKNKDFDFFDFKDFCRFKKVSEKLKNPDSFRASFFESVYNIIEQHSILSEEQLEIALKIYEEEKDKPRDCYFIPTKEEGNDNDFSSHTGGKKQFQKTLQLKK